MRTILRLLLAPSALAVGAAANAAVSVYFAFDAAPSVALTALPLTSTSIGLSVYYKSDQPITDSEIFLGYDRSTTQGVAATPLDNKVSLTNPVAVAGSTAINGVRVAGGAGTGTRPYGLNLLSVSAPTGTLPASTTGFKLFGVTLNNLALTTGQSATLSFNTATAPQFTTNFVDPAGLPMPLSATSLIVTAAPVPEPATFAALGVGVLGLLRRRKRAQS